ncbi:hypothetical protein [Kitasatospora purpeofusca]|uniref:hypothetical protein n=1 Tax=Kitasatospora purpeofusca TaxID=67352 RepID=UPI00365D0770
MRIFRNPWLGVHFLIGVVALVIAVAVIVELSVTGDPVSVVLAGISGIWLTLRIPFCRTVLSSEGVAYHGLFATRRAGWGDVAGIGKGFSGGALAVSSFPILTLTGGKEIEMMTLAGYGEDNRRVERVVGAMGEFLSGHRAGRGKE